MKRNLLHIFLPFAVWVMMLSLPACRSSKKSNSEFYHSQIDRLAKGKHGDGKGYKVSKDISKTRKKILEEALSWHGTPYGYGKSEKGVASDCSGMVMSVYEDIAGIKLPRNSAKQQDFCRNLKKNDVVPGDLCFFATGKDPDKTSHVGIMIDERNFIHASTSKGVVVSDISQPYWVRTFKGYGRVPDLKD